MGVVERPTESKSVTAWQRGRVRTVSRWSAVARGRARRSAGAGSSHRMVWYASLAGVFATRENPPPTPWIVRRACLTLTIALASLGEGACGARSGLRSGETLAEETCNGVDDDQDGLVDEDFPTQSCGIGACRVEVPGCEAGRVPACRPRAPSQEVCNQVDDDCDGVVDEGLGLELVQGPTVVRDAEGQWADCQECPSATSMQLVTTEPGMIAIWTLGLLGTDPIPNLYTRGLSAQGEPRGLPTVVGDEWVLSGGVRASPSSAGRTLLTYCGRKFHEDRAASLWLDAEGHATGESMFRAPASADCGAMVPDGVWSGSHHLIAWTENSGGYPESGGWPDPNVALLDVSNERGESLDYRELEPWAEFGTSPRLAVGHGGVLVVFGLNARAGTQDLQTEVLDGAGGLLLGPSFVERIGESRWEQIAVEVTDSGWVIAARNALPGVFLIRLDRRGRVSRTQEFEASSTLGRLELTRFGESGLVLSGSEWDGAWEQNRLVISTLDGEGQPVETWRSDPSAIPQSGAHAVAISKGRIYVLYGEPRKENEPNRVMLIGLGCEGRNR